MSHQLLESISFSPIDATEEFSSCKNFPSLFNDLASILAADADDNKDKDQDGDSGRDDEGVIEKEVGHMERRNRDTNCNKGSDRDGEEEEDGDGNGDQVDDKNKNEDDNTNMDDFSNSYLSTSRKYIVMG